MSSRKVVTAVGAGAVGLGAYYLYNAGGSPKVAEKQFERMNSSTTLLQDRH
jgi:hypothetical protein